MEATPLSNTKSFSDTATDWCMTEPTFEGSTAVWFTTGPHVQVQWYMIWLSKKRTKCVVYISDYSHAIPLKVTVQDLHCSLWMAKGIRQTHTQSDDVWRVIRSESYVIVLQHLEVLVWRVSIKEQEEKRAEKSWK